MGPWGILHVGHAWRREVHGRAPALRPCQKPTPPLVLDAGPCRNALRSFTALARLAAVAGDGRRALALGEKLVSQGAPPKLRNFTPALNAFAADRQVCVRRLVHQRAGWGPSIAVLVAYGMLKV